ncbi:uncharacterized protein LOC123507726 [Portunus trituberculatus]|uniref:uncharacterized protein LOC123507726 n=1 Tax=Portunus trituberculatus TaxID=210409 RepID=UPI001E1CD751|nr:uncharacterized protein LOC123507726 [Portunus trituberculatus]
MSSPPHHDPLRPLLQTVCHAGLLTLAALMADQAHQLPHLGLDSLSNLPPRQPSNTNDQTTCTESDEATVDVADLQNPEVEAQRDVPTPSLLSDGGKDLSDGRRSCRCWSCPVRQSTASTRTGTSCSVHLLATVTGRPSDISGRSDKAEGEVSEVSPVAPCGAPDMECTQTTTEAEWKETVPEENSATDEAPGIPEASSCRHPILASVGTAEDTVPHIDVAPKDTQDQAPVILPEVTMVTPKIKLHAGSVEVEEDYLEGHLDEDHHLRDFCATLLGECDWQSSRPPSTQTPVVGLLSVTSHDPCSRRAPKVPFDAVVFTERKPSTGDALVLSLGLSADGANTIQDIASRNQGAARERLQQGEVLPCGAGLTKHCESCGVSPEECLKKLGLHSDTIRPVASPKSERLLHFFKHIPADIHTRVPGSTTHGPLSPHDFDHGLTSPKQKSRSLSSSPTNVENDGRKSRLVAL